MTGGGGYEMGCLLDLVVFDGSPDVSRDALDFFWWCKVGRSVGKRALAL